MEESEESEPTRSTYNELHYDASHPEKVVEGVVLVWHASDDGGSLGTICKDTFADHQDIALDTVHLANMMCTELGYGNGHFVYFE